MDYCSLTNSLVGESPNKKTFFQEMKNSPSLEDSINRANARDNAIDSQGYKTPEKSDVLKKIEEENRTEHHKKYFKDVFPDIEDDFQVRDKDVQGLEKRFKEMNEKAEELKKLRNYFAHSCDSREQNSEEIKNQKVNIEKIEKRIEEYSELIEKIVVMYNCGAGQSTKLFASNSEETCNSIIDICLFGSNWSLWKELNWKKLDDHARNEELLLREKLVEEKLKAADEYKSLREKLLYESLENSQ